MNTEIERNVKIDEWSTRHPIISIDAETLKNTNMRDFVLKIHRYGRAANACGSAEMLPKSILGYMKMFLQYDVKQYLIGIHEINGMNFMEAAVVLTDRSIMKITSVEKGFTDRSVFIRRSVNVPNMYINIY